MEHGVHLDNMGFYYLIQIKIDRLID